MQTGRLLRSDFAAIRAGAEVWKCRIGMALICLAAILWASVGVATQLMDSDIDAAQIGLIRTLIGSICILMITTLRTGTATNYSNRLSGGGGPMWLLVFGICGATFQICLFSGFQHSGVTITVAVTVCLPPLIVATVEAMWWRRPPALSLMLAILVAAVGVALVLVHGNGTVMAGAVPDLRGGALLIGASGAFAGVAISARHIGGGISVSQATGRGLAVTAVVLFVVVLARPTALSPEALSLSWVDFAVLLYVGVFATGMAYLAFVLGLQLCRTTGAGMAATMIEPVAAAVFAALLLQERLSALQLLGCATMLLAMGILFRFERPAPLKPTAKGFE